MPDLSLFVIPSSTRAETDKTNIVIRRKASYSAALSLLQCASGMDTVIASIPVGNPTATATGADDNISIRPRLILKTDLSTLSSNPITPPESPTSMQSRQSNKRKHDEIEPFVKATRRISPRRRLDSPVSRLVPAYAPPHSDDDGTSSTTSVDAPVTPPKRAARHSHIATPPSSKKRKVAATKPTRPPTNGPRRTGQMTIDQRFALLAADPFIAPGTVTPTSVCCLSCNATIKLDARNYYYPGLWTKHRKGCVGSEFVTKNERLDVQVPMDVDVEVSLEEGRSVLAHKRHQWHRRHAGLPLHLRRLALRRPYNSLDL